MFTAWRTVEVGISIAALQLFYLVFMAIEARVWSRCLFKIWQWPIWINAATQYHIVFARVTYEHRIAGIWCLEGKSKRATFGPGWRRWRKIGKAACVTRIRRRFGDVRNCHHRMGLLRSHIIRWRRLQEWRQWIWAGCVCSVCHNSMARECTFRVQSWKYGNRRRRASANVRGRCKSGVSWFSVSQKHSILAISNDWYEPISQIVFYGSW